MSAISGDLFTDGVGLLAPYFSRHETRWHTFSANMPASTSSERVRLRAALRTVEVGHPHEVAAVRAYLNDCASESTLWRRDARAALDYLATLA